jgi:hypothetical protein
MPVLVADAAGRDPAMGTLVAPVGTPNITEVALSHESSFDQPLGVLDWPQ